MNFGIRIGQVFYSIIYHFSVSLAKTIGYIRGVFYSQGVSNNLRYFHELIMTYQYKRLFSAIGKGTIIAKLRRLDGASNISLGGGIYIGRDSIISCWSEINPDARIVIGNDCSFGEFNHISSCKSIVIGNGVLTGRFVYISDNNHGIYLSENRCVDYQLNSPPHRRSIGIKGEVQISDNVWIGDKVSILSGVKIGESAVIAANSVVTHDVPPKCIVGGIPARVIRQL